MALAAAAVVATLALAVRPALADAAWDAAAEVYGSNYRSMTAGETHLPDHPMDCRYRVGCNRSPLPLPSPSPSPSLFPPSLPLRPCATPVATPLCCVAVARQRCGTRRANADGAAHGREPTNTSCPDATIDVYARARTRVRVRCGANPVRWAACGVDVLVLRRGGVFRVAWRRGGVVACTGSPCPCSFPDADIHCEINGGLTRCRKTRSEMALCFAFVSLGDLRHAQGPQGRAGGRADAYVCACATTRTSVRHFGLPAPDPYLRGAVDHQLPRV